jgi:hypothetical protein
MRCWLDRAHSRALACALVMGCAPACSSDGSQPTPAASITEPDVPAPSVSPVAAGEPAWAAKLPDVLPPVVAAQRVWAAPPLRGSEMVDIGVYTVEGVHDRRVSLTDRLGQRIDGVPGALVHAARIGPKLAEGDIVLCYAWTLSAVLARVAKLSSGQEIEVQYDWAGTTKSSTIEHCQPPLGGLEPLAFVGFPKGGAVSRGQLIALSREQGWVRTASGHVELHPVRALQPLALPRTDRAVGEKVRAYSWATGFQPGVVSKVLESGLRYRVKLDGDKPERDYFFTMLVDAPLSGSEPKVPAPQPKVPAPEPKVPAPVSTP